MTVDAPLPQDDATFEKLENLLCNLDQQTPLDKRFRALFTLKTYGSSRAIDIIAKAFKYSDPLLKHELAYVLGQIGNWHASTCLINVLSDMDEDCMVRHEAGEALGALGNPEALPVLRKFIKDENRSVRETCEIAIDRLEYAVKKQAAQAAAGDKSESAYTSVDPAPAFAQDESENSIPTLRATLLDTSVPLFKRYQAMFSLRNIGTDEAVLALAEGLTDDSALFKHEVAFVFGQMQHEAAVPALIKTLEDLTEESMVRHEAAEALGSIASPECLPVLKQFTNDKDQVVRDSCIVALDMYNYENSNQFQYADGLTA